MEQRKCPVIALEANLEFRVLHSPPELAVTLPAPRTAPAAPLQTAHRGESWLHPFRAGRRPRGPAPYGQRAHAGVATRAMRHWLHRVGSAPEGLLP